MFSGEQIQPWLCRTQLQGGTTPALGPAVDEKCNAAAPVVEQFYRSPGNPWVVYDPISPPDAVGDRADDDRPGQDGPVHHPARDGNRQPRHLPDRGAGRSDQADQPWSTEQPWNRKYVNTFGGACSVNYQQPTVGDVRNVARLGLGFAVGTSSLNTYANSCSDVISAEALMMTKEIITELQSTRLPFASVPIPLPCSLLPLFSLPAPPSTPPPPSTTTHTPHATSPPGRRRSVMISFVIISASAEITSLHELA